MFYTYSFTKCVVLFLVLRPCLGDFEEKVRELAREKREQGCPIYNAVSHGCGGTHSCNTLLLSLACIAGFLLILLFMGLIKGCLGLYCLPLIGMWGLGILVDLPRPLDEYQEPELKNYPVEYDEIGWPIHPETKDRSVRAVTRQTEFCLNCIFFLTYPVVTLIEIFTLWCFETYDHDNDTNQCFQNVNTVVFCNCSGKKKCYVGKTQTKNVHKTQYDDENDAMEEQDTAYVLNMLRCSQDSLQANGMPWKFN